MVLSSGNIFVLLQFLPSSLPQIAMLNLNLTVINVHVTTNPLLI